MASIPGELCGTILSISRPDTNGVSWCHIASEHPVPMLINRVTVTVKVRLDGGRVVTAVLWGDLALQVYCELDRGDCLTVQGRFLTPVLFRANRPELEILDDE